MKKEYRFLKGCHHYYTLVEINASLCIYYQALRANSEKRLIYVPHVKRFFASRNILHNVSSKRNVS